MGPSSKTSSKVGKAASNGISKHSSRSISSVCFSYLTCIVWNSLRRLIFYVLALLESHTNKRVKARASDVYSGQSCSVSSIIECQGLKQGSWHYTSKFSLDVNSIHSTFSICTCLFTGG
jgi:hypothetical protein